jgi:hypothetical protein
MFGPLFSESAYFSDAKTTFEMFGMISFGVDSQTHTVWIAQIIMRVARCATIQLFDFGRILPFWLVVCMHGEMGLNK